jgi:hypothetical protein
LANGTSSSELSSFWSSTLGFFFIADDSFGFFADAGGVGFRAEGVSFFTSLFASPPFPPPPKAPFLFSI